MKQSSEKENAVLRTQIQNDQNGWSCNGKLKTLPKSNKENMYLNKRKTKYTWNI